MLGILVSIVTLVLDVYMGQRNYTLGSLGAIVRFQDSQSQQS